MMQLIFAAGFAAWPLLSPVEALPSDTPPLPPLELPHVARADLAVELVAREPDIVTPIQLQVDSRGRVWVIESNTHFPEESYKRHPSDRILILDEFQKDGKAGRIRVFADGFHQAMALALHGEGKVYLATRREVLLLEDSSGEGRAGRTTRLARLETEEQYPHNGLSGFAFDGLGNVFFSIGENMGVAYRLTGTDGSSVAGGPEGGSIFRMREDGKELTRWALGFWNTFHLGFDAYGRLFAVDNDPDSRPPCRLLHIVRGGDYGYRRWLGRKGLHPFTCWNGELTGSLPMVCGTGEAPSGVVAYEEPLGGWPARDAIAGLPRDLEGKLIATSWGDHRVDSYPLEERGASYRSHFVPLVEGDENFRPVSIAAAPDGSLVFSDWVDKEYHVHGKGRIWRLKRKGPPQSSDAGKASVKSRERYVELLEQAKQGGLAKDGGLIGLESSDPAIRAAAVRLEGETKGLTTAVFLKLLKDPSPSVQMEALLGLREKPGAGENGVLESILSLSKSADPFIASTAMEALSRLAGVDWLLAARKDPDPARRAAVLIALKRSGDPRAKTSLDDFLKDPDLEIKRAALQWIGDERLQGFRGAAQGVLESGPVSRAIFDAYLAADGLLSGKAPDQRDTLESNEFLLGLANDKSKPAQVRRLALRSVEPAFPPLTLKVLKHFLAEDDAGLRLEAMRSIRESPAPEARALLSGIAADKEASLAVRREAVSGLARFLPASGEDLKKLQAGGESLLSMEAERAIRLGAEAGSEKSAYSESETKELLKNGDPAEGEILFFYPRGARCSTCHAVRGRGGLAGPDLSAAGYTARAKHLESILSPGKEIAPQFSTWLITTPDGPRTGTILGEDAESGALLLGTASGAVERIARKAVLSWTLTEVSLMPEGLARSLTIPELRDLLAFLESLR